MEFDLRTCTEEILDLVASQAHARGLELNLLISDDVPLKLKGDLVKLSQVLTLLLINAVENTVSGEIRLQVALQAETVDMATLLISLVSTSVVLTAQEHFAIAKFFAHGELPIDATVTPEIGHAAVSTELHICRELVDMIAGEIGLEINDGDRGKETEFWLASTFEKQTQKLTVMPEVELTSVNLLLISENNTNRSVLRHYAKKWHVEADESINAAMAMNAMRRAVNDQQPYNIAIIDMQMSVLSGEILGKTILADPALKQTKLVLMVPMHRQHEIELLLEQGFAACLIKPIKQFPLLQALVEAGARLRAANQKAGSAKEKSSNLNSDRATNVEAKSISMQNSAVLDFEHLIRICEGNEEIITKLIDQFLEDSPKCIDALKEAIANEDFFALKQSAHFLKGASATIGMKVMKPLAKQIEQEAIDQSLRESSMLVEALEKSTATLQQQRDHILQIVREKLIDMPDGEIPLEQMPQISDREVHILLVDDDRMTLTWVTDSLKKIPNYVVTTAANGEEAWKHISVKAFDVIISDWSMPDMSGIVLCQRIKFCPQLPSANSPFILLTAYSDSEYQKIAQDAGVDDFLVKPVNPEELRAKIALWSLDHGADA